MIPKVIHYCWFGGNSLPEKYKKYIRTWESFLPGYNIVEWNENNFDINSCDYVMEAYRAKKWAFVSDYARFKILYENGGVYLDTDVELIKDMSVLIDRGPFMGCEYNDNNSLGLDCLVNPGLGFAVESNNELLKEILSEYENRHFIKEGGEYDLTTICEFTTKFFVRDGFKGGKEVERIGEFTILPPEYLCPIDNRVGKMFLTENTFSIHHYDASWNSKMTRTKSYIYKKLISIFGVEKIERFRKKKRE